MHANALFIFVAAALSAINASPVIMPKRMNLPVFYHPAARADTGIVPTAHVDPVPSPAAAPVAPVAISDPIPDASLTAPVQAMELPAIAPVPMVDPAPTAVAAPTVQSRMISRPLHPMPRPAPQAIADPVPSTGTAAPMIQQRMIARPVIPSLPQPEAPSQPLGTAGAPAPTAVPARIQQIKAQLPALNQPLASVQAMLDSGIQPTAAPSGVAPPMISTPMTGTSGQAQPPMPASKGGVAAMSLSPASAPVLSVAAIKEKAAAKEAAAKLAAEQAALAAAAKAAADRLAAQQMAAAAAAVTGRTTTNTVARPAALSTSNVASAKYTLIRQNGLCEGTTTRLPKSGAYIPAMVAGTAKCADLCRGYQGAACSHFVVVGTGASARCHLHQSCGTIGRSATTSAVYKMG